jgi:hypothetical protein
MRGKEYFYGYFYLDMLLDFDVIEYNGKQCAVFPLVENGVIKKFKHVTIPLVVSETPKTYENPNWFSHYMKIFYSKTLKKKLPILNRNFMGNFIRKFTTKY